MFVLQSEYKRVLIEWEKVENQLNRAYHDINGLNIRVLELEVRNNELERLVIRQRRVMFLGSDMNQGLINAIRENFRKKLQERTSWGRNEVMLAFEQAVAEGAVAFIDQNNNQQQIKKD